VTVEQTGDALTFRVTDNGPGIAPTQQAHLFPWFRLNAASHEASEHAGIGLSITKKIVENYGGQLTLESQGAGTTCQFTWPKASSSTTRD
jgi:signal transduction histidine kinase